MPHRKHREKVGLRGRAAREPPQPDPGVVHLQPCRRHHGLAEPRANAVPLRRSAIGSEHLHHQVGKAVAPIPRSSQWHGRRCGAARRAHFHHAKVGLNPPVKGGRNRTSVPVAPGWCQTAPRRWPCRPSSGPRSLDRRRSKAQHGRIVQGGQVVGVVEPIPPPWANRETPCRLNHQRQGCCPSERPSTGPVPEDAPHHCSDAFLVEPDLGIPPQPLEHQFNWLSGKVCGHRERRGELHRQPVRRSRGSETWLCRPGAVQRDGDLILYRSGRPGSGPPVRSRTTPTIVRTRNNSTGLPIVSSALLLRLLCRAPPDGPYTGRVPSCVSPRCPSTGAASYHTGPLVGCAPSLFPAPVVRGRSSP